MAKEKDDIDISAQKGIVAPVVSFFSVAFGFVRILFEEGIMGAPIISTFMKLFSSFVDPIMAVWIAVIMVAGYWLKRSKLPKWLPPLPVLLLAMYMAVGLLFGWLQYEVESWKGLLRVLLYGIGNGLVYTGFSFIIYDIGHGAIKQSKAKKAAKEAA